jgi:predicted glycosyltransferase
MQASSASPCVLIYVQHLLGVGHLQRSIQLAAALQDRGFRVEIVSGGMPAAMHLTDGLNFHQLPPLYSADGSFTRLLDENGRAIDDAWRARRKRELLEIFTSLAPRVLITETFPFGRRMLRFELLPLLQASRSSCELVICSIRDILQPRAKAERNRETCELLDAYYDHVLVHGDARIARLEDSFALAGSIDRKLFYSGYICARDAQQPPSTEGLDEVIVSAGGSATGLRLLTTALAAKPLSDLRELHWRLLVSPAIAAADFDALQRRADVGVTIERNRPDFSALVKRARLSISQAGYNTVTDILSSDTPAVVVPYAEANEIEQTLRARALEQCGRLVALPESELGANALAQAMSRAQRQNTTLSVDLDGASNSAAMIAHWLDQAGTSA